MNVHAARLGSSPWVVRFEDAAGLDKNTVGGKGYGLATMARMGLPVPTGFIVTTDAGRAAHATGRIPDDLTDRIRRHLHALEQESGARLGDPVAPLLVSVRSGAPASMPGMMDTVLNCGMTREIAESMGRGGKETFALSSYERLLRSFAVTVRKLSEADVEDALLDVEGAGEEVQGLRQRCDVLERLIEDMSGLRFPDPWGQLEEAIAAVFGSWMSPRAIAYRNHKGISDDLGTAVVVQKMVFGNLGPDSCSGVAFTRDPATGDGGVYGEVLFDAQGEDVVDGSRDAEPLTALAERLPDAYAELMRCVELLEREFRDMCDIEFTVEAGRLWILQTRVGQRSARAAVRLAVAMLDEGLIDEHTALMRVTEEQLRAAHTPLLAAVPDPLVIARGRAASPGAAVGPAVFDPIRCIELAEQGVRPVLVRPTTSPADIPAILRSAAVVTGRGGTTSHAAVVTRGLNLPCVCGAGHVRSLNGGQGRPAAVLIDGVEVREGEIVSVDGDGGLLVRGEVPTVAATSDRLVGRFEELYARHAQHRGGAVSTTAGVTGGVS